MSQVWTSVILPDFSESLLKTLQIITTISLNTSTTGSPSPNPLISPTEEFTTSPSAISSPSLNPSPISSPSLNPSPISSPSLNRSAISSPSPSLNQSTPTSPSVTIHPAITSNSKHLSFLFRNVFFVVQLNAQGCLTLFGSCPYLGMLYLIITP